LQRLDQHLAFPVAWSALFSPVICERAAILFIIRVRQTLAEKARFMGQTQSAGISAVNPRPWLFASRSAFNRGGRQSRPAQ
jgi:hypothetical protein